MILPIKKYPDPFLTKPCQPWDFENPPRGLERFVVQDLTETMIDSGGIGLAANQVGIGYRLLAIHVQATQEFLIMANPEIIESSEEMWLAPEGCLSFPGVELKIARAKQVTVRWFNMMGVRHTGVFTDIDAKCIQHEIDHLDGIVFKDLVSDLKYKLAVQHSRKKAA
jgi:peptide deformylase